MLALLLLQGCSTLMGPGVDPRVLVPSDAIVTNLRDYSVLDVKGESEDTFFVRVKNGQRHVLRVERESSTSYVFLDPKPSSSAFLNVISPFMLGFVVDHITQAAYEMRQASIDATILTESTEHRAYEDSLRKWLRPVVPTSVLDPSKTPLVFTWFSSAIDINTSKSWLGLGAGIQLTPLVMPIVEAGIVLTERTTSKPFWMACGIQAQEQERGLCAALRIGYVLSGIPDGADSPALFGTASAGIYGQWARLELRYRHTFSSHSNIVSETRQIGYLGVHFAIHIIL